jgi:8-oxo-dGTP pyrophosphatase MutT (NUDIX family)
MSKVTTLPSVSQCGISRCWNINNNGIFRVQLPYDYGTYIWDWDYRLAADIIRLHQQRNSADVAGVVICIVYSPEPENLAMEVNYDPASHSHSRTKDCAQILMVLNTQFKVGFPAGRPEQDEKERLSELWKQKLDTSHLYLQRYEENYDTDGCAVETEEKSNPSIEFINTILEIGQRELLEETGITEELLRLRPENYSYSAPSEKGLSHIFVVTTSDHAQFTRWSQSSCIHSSSYFTEILSPTPIPIPLYYENVAANLKSANRDVKKYAKRNFIGWIRSEPLRESKTTMLLMFIEAGVLDELTANMICDLAEIRRLERAQVEAAQERAKTRMEKLAENLFQDRQFYIDKESHPDYTYFNPCL